MCVDDDATHLEPLEEAPLAVHEGGRRLSVLCTHMHRTTAQVDDLACVLVFTQQAASLLSPHTWVAAVTTNLARVRTTTDTRQRVLGATAHTASPQLAWKGNGRTAAASGVHIARWRREGACCCQIDVVFAQQAAKEVLQLAWLAGQHICDL